MILTVGLGACLSQEKFDIFSTLLINENVFKALGRIKIKKSALVLILYVLVLVLVLYFGLFLGVGLVSSGLGFGLKNLVLFTSLL